MSGKLFTGLTMLRFILSFPLLIFVLFYIVPCDYSVIAMICQKVYNFFNRLLLAMIPFFFFYKERIY